MFCLETIEYLNVQMNIFSNKDNEKNVKIENNDLETQIIEYNVFKAYIYIMLLELNNDLKEP